jgi:hypothetical protein
MSIKQKILLVVQEVKLAMKRVDMDGFVLITSTYFKVRNTRNILSVLPLTGEAIVDLCDIRTLRITLVYRRVHSRPVNVSDHYFHQKQTK